VAFAEDAPDTSDDQVAEVRGALSDLDREIDRFGAVQEYVRLYAARDSSGAVYPRAPARPPPRPTRR